MARPAVDRFLTRLVWLDRVADPIQRFVGATFKTLGPLGRSLKDLLHGTRMLRHPLHPALTDVPFGAWLTGVVADYVAIATDVLPRAAGTVALAVGLAGALGAVVTGYTDFHETYGLERRTAMAHGLLMTVVFVIEVVSLAFRLTGVLYPLAVGLATAGLAVTVLGMYLGGHVVYGFGTVVNRGAFVEGPGEYVVVGVPEDFPEGEMRRVQANGMPVLVVRHRSALHAISSVCSHAGGPLDEGTLEEDVVTCPWHGSRFLLRDGSIRGGPATFPQPHLQARERDGKVEVKLAEPSH
jgi:nitrite reductase/ring-hydroxylating ferredoxin subunit/uncharacterized membrane protein